MSEMPSNNRICLIFHFILCTGHSVEVRQGLLSLLADKSPEGTELSRLAKAADEYGKRHGQPPTFQYMLEAERFPFNLNMVVDQLSASDVKELIQHEIEFQRKQLFGETVHQAMQELGTKTSAEIVEDISEALNSLQVGTAKYTAPPDLMDIYESGKNKSIGALTFVKPLDDVLMGLEFGNVMTVAGFAGSFKTTFGVNFAYGNSVELGFNSVVLTLEVPRDYLRFMLLSRHSYNPKFASKWEPIPHEALRKRTLTEEEEKRAREIYDDLTTNPEYGRITVLELFDLVDIGYHSMKSFLSELPEPPDIFVIDYIQLLQYYQGKGIRLDRTSSMIDYFMRQLTMLCQNINGRKMAGLVLAQTNREGYRYAMDNGGKYLLPHLAESNELEKSSFAVSFLYTDDALRESKEIKVCLPKNRGGQIITEPFITQVDPSCCVLGDSLAGFNNPTSMDFSSLLSPFGGGFTI